MSVMAVLVLQLKKYVKTIINLRSSKAILTIDQCQGGKFAFTSKTNINFQDHSIFIDFANHNSCITFEWN